MTGMKMKIRVEATAKMPIQISIPARLMNGTMVWTPTVMVVMILIKMEMALEAWRKAVATTVMTLTHRSTPQPSKH